MKSIIMTVPEPQLSMSAPEGKGRPGDDCEMGPLSLERRVLIGLIKVCPVLAITSGAYLNVPRKPKWLRSGFIEGAA